MPKYLVSGIAGVPYEYEVEADSVIEAKGKGSIRALDEIEGAVVATTHEAELDEI